MGHYVLGDTLSVYPEAVSNNKRSFGFSFENGGNLIYRRNYKSYTNNVIKNITGNNLIFETHTNYLKQKN